MLSEALLLLILFALGVGFIGLLYTARNFGWLSLCPQIEDDGQRLIAQTGRLPWLLTLTLWYRAVAVDSLQREVVVSQLFFWVWSRTLRVPFDEIAAVLYHFEEGTLTIALRRTAGEPVHLFYFWGPFDDAGRTADPRDEDDFFENLGRSRPFRLRWNLPWGLVFEQRDYSERTALAFAERLQEMTGAPLAA